MSNGFKPKYMADSDYIRSKQDIEALECELGMEPRQLYKTKWTDLKALHKAGKLHENDMHVLFVRKAVFDTSLYDCVLNSDCEIVHKTDVYEYKMRERAKAMRNLFR